MILAGRIPAFGQPDLGLFGADDGIRTRDPHLGKVSPTPARTGLIAPDLRKPFLLRRIVPHRFATSRGLSAA